MRVLIDVIFYAVFLMVHILMMENYKGCYVPLDLMMVIMFSAIIWVRISFYFYSRRIAHILSLLCLVFGIVVLVVSITSGLVFMILIEIFFSKCMPFNLKVLDWIIIGAGNFLIMMAVIAIILIYIQYRQDLKQVEETQRKVLEVYEKIMNPKFDAESFVEEHRETIDREKLANEEYARLLDYCGEKWEVDQSEMEESEKKECSICLQIFEQNQSVIRHPLCRHTFHRDCLNPWIASDLHCPMCKRGTRSSLILQIHRRVVEGKSVAAGSRRASTSVNDASIL